MLSPQRIFIFFFVFVLIIFTQKASAETSLTINGKSVTPTNDVSLNIQITGNDVTIIESLPTPSPVPQEPTKKFIKQEHNNNDERETEKKERQKRKRINPTKAPPNPKSAIVVTPTKRTTPSPVITESAENISPIFDDKKLFIMEAINNYRKSHDLSPVRTDIYTCNFAKTRAQEIVSDFSHDGFRERAAQKSLPFPGYSLVTENLARTSDYKRVVTLWINSSGHAANMRKDTPFVCVESSGDYYAYIGWKP